MMPFPENFHNTERGEKISSLLAESDFDVVLLQKMFCKTTLQQMEKTLKTSFPQRFDPPNEKIGFNLNSGLWSLGRIGLNFIASIDFKTPGYGVELFANKGAILLGGNWGGQEYQILNTHLQGDDWTESDHSANHQNIRDKQLVELREFLDRHRRNNVPQIICGDFCMPRNRKMPGETQNHFAAYERMLDILGAEHDHNHRETWVDDSPTDSFVSDNLTNLNEMARAHSGVRWEMDYVLLRRNGATHMTINRKLKILRRNWNDGKRNRRDLSYRYAVEASIDFNND